MYEDDIIKQTRKKLSGLVSLHRTSDEKHSRNRPIILTSLIVYVDYIIMKKARKRFLRFGQGNLFSKPRNQKMDKKTATFF